MRTPQESDRAQARPRAEPIVTLANHAPRLERRDMIQGLAGNGRALGNARRLAPRGIYCNFVPRRKKESTPVDQCLLTSDDFMVPELLDCDYEKGNTNVSREHRIPADSSEPEADIPDTVKLTRPGICSSIGVLPK